MAKVLASDSLVNMQIIRLDGSKEKIQQALTSGYKTSAGGKQVPARCLIKKGRRLQEIEKPAAGEFEDTEEGYVKLLKASSKKPAKEKKSSKKPASEKKSSKRSKPKKTEVASAVQHEMPQAPELSGHQFTQEFAEKLVSYLQEMTAGLHRPDVRVVCGVELPEDDGQGVTELRASISMSIEEVVMQAPDLSSRAIKRTTTKGKANYDLRASKFKKAKAALVEAYGETFEVEALMMEAVAGSSGTKACYIFAGLDEEAKVVLQNVDSGKLRTATVKQIVSKLDLFEKETPSATDWDEDDFEEDGEADLVSDTSGEFEDEFEDDFEADDELEDDLEEDQDDVVEAPGEYTRTEMVELLVEEGELTEKSAKRLKDSDISELFYETFDVDEDEAQEALDEEDELEEVEDELEEVGDELEEVEDDDDEDTPESWTIRQVREALIHQEELTEKSASRMDEDALLELFHDVFETTIVLVEEGELEAESWTMEQVEAYLIGEGEITIKSAARTSAEDMLELFASVNEDPFYIVDEEAEEEAEEELDVEDVKAYLIGEGELTSKGADRMSDEDLIQLYESLTSDDVDDEDEDGDSVFDDDEPEILELGDVNFNLPRDEIISLVLMNYTEEKVLAYIEEFLDERMTEDQKEALDDIESGDIQTLSELLADIELSLLTSQEEDEDGFIEQLDEEL